MTTESKDRATELMKTIAHDVTAVVFGECKGQAVIQLSKEGKITITACDGEDTLVLTVQRGTEVFEATKANSLGDTKH